MAGMYPTWSLFINAWQNSKTVIPASEARRESFFGDIGKIPDKPE